MPKMAFTAGSRGGDPAETETVFRKNEKTVPLLVFAEVARGDTNKRSKQLLFTSQSVGCQFSSMGKKFIKHTFMVPKSD
jgi:hypothetical protein